MVVYLSGTITADRLTHDWRRRATAALEGTDPFIDVRDPLRGKDLASLSADGLQCGNIPSLLVTRDKKDIRESDVMLINTVGMEALKRQSIGTWSEMGYADAHGVALIIVATHPDILRHPFIQEAPATIVATLEEAIAAILWLR